MTTLLTLDWFSLADFLLLWAAVLLLLVALMGVLAGLEIEEPQKESPEKPSESLERRP